LRKTAAKWETKNSSVGFSLVKLLHGRSRLEIPYPCTKLHTRELIFYPDTKLHIEVQNNIPRYKTTYPGTKLHTQVQNSIPGYKTTHPGIDFPTLLQNYIPRYKTTYPDTKLHTQVQNNIPRYKTTYPGTKVHPRVRHLLPRYKTFVEKPASDTSPTSSCCHRSLLRRFKQHSAPLNTFDFWLRRVRVFREQGDRMSFEKYRPKCSPTHFFAKISTHITLKVGKSRPKMKSNLEFLINLPTVAQLVKTRPTG
jgi:hypothetical protein